MNKQVAVFSRVAGYTVNKVLSPEHRSKSADQAQLLINNMNLINQTLMQMAVKLVNKVKGCNDIDSEELTLNLQDIIYISVVAYARRAY